MSDKNLERLAWLKEHLLSAAIVVGGVMIGLFVLLNSFEESAPSVLTDSSDKDVTTDHIQESSSLVEEISFVDVKGQVNAPGVYQVASQMRVIDAVNLAGGFTEEADQEQVNLALLVVDQMVIFVPKVGEISTDKQVSILAEHTDKVNLNTATIEELQTLSGIGLSKAQAIVAHREENGSFQTTEDLKNVKGVGEKTFDSLRESITID